MKEYYLELMVKIANSVVTTLTTTSCKHIIVIIITILFIFFTIHFCSKNFWHNHHRRPMFTFHHSSSGNKDILYCVVCLREVVDGERFRKLPKCKHCFHVNCIDIWLESNSTCPLCRNQVCLVNHRQRNLGLLPQFLSVLEFFLGKIFNPQINLEISLVLGENSRHIL